MKAKYVILRDADKREVVFVIDAVMYHSTFASYFPRWEVVSAGFCSIDSFDPDRSDRPLVTAWGESVSLNVKSREEDSDILSGHLSSI